MNVEMDAYEQVEQFLDAVDNDAPASEIDFKLVQLQALRAVADAMAATARLERGYVQHVAGWYTAEELADEQSRRDADHQIADWKRRKQTVHP